ncbi:hypothetical protein ACFOKF_18930 [Sphingobium rhizovicinum]|uniref:Uncharacterized protein n=1 Tax=Sphingobium rhizovicinum TaxID=432308 RepID=A0ABV7NIB0_9SPHN
MMATLARTEDIEDSARQAPALIRYLDEGDFVTRRYVSQGVEINTGTYSDHRMLVRDGMPIRDHFEFDTHGFMLADIAARSAISSTRRRSIASICANARRRYRRSPLRPACRRAGG